MSGEIEDDVLELGEAPDSVAAADGAETVPAAEADEDVEIPTFGDIGDEEVGDTDLVKHLRAQVRDRDRRLKEVASPKPEPEIVVGEKPTLESCDYDEDRHEAELIAYHDRKRQAEAKANEGKEAQQKAQNELAQVVTSYNEKKAALPYPDKDDMEATVLASLNPAQQEIAIRIAGDPAKLFYALGRNPAKLATLAGMGVTDIATVAKFGAAIAKLDGELKMAKRRPTAEPDRPVRGSASMAATSDKHLEKLEKEADRTGDRTAVIAYKREKKRAAA